MDVFEELVRLRGQGRKCALATIVDVRGSIPSYATAKLLVRDDGSMASTDDMRVLKLAVATPARYIAMIGSKRKVIGVLRELEKEGVLRAAFARLHAPMGLDIGAISPEEIAIS